MLTNDKPESVQENKTHKILFECEIQTDLQTQVRQPASFD